MRSASLVAWAAACHPTAPPLPAGGPVAALAPGAGATWSADAVGVAYERSLAAAPRQASGAFYTPRAIAEGVVALALPDPVDAAPVLDPAVGGGAFLLAAARRLERSGASRREIVEHRLFGIDTDAGALEATAVALALWAGPDADGWPDARPHLHLADTIATPPATLLTMLGCELQAVVGNPPFLGQLRTRTTRERAHAAEVQAALPGVAGAYTDAAALFLLSASRLVRPGGRVALVVPESLLSARDAAGVRAAVLDDATLEHLWVAREPVFEAATRVCAPVLRRHPPGVVRQPGPVGRSAGAAFEPARSAGTVEDRAGTWGHLVAGLHGVPLVDLGDGPGLETWAEVTAGFRQQFYGVQPVVVEGGARDAADDRPWLVTSGSIDPLVCRWGSVPTAFARRRWAAPRVDLETLARQDAALHRWAVARLRPKVVVATQTRVVEAAVDHAGRWYPSTPTVAVAPHDPSPGRLWATAAVLTAPPVSAWLHGRLGGSALAAGHLRITAPALRAVPLPSPSEAFERGATLARQVDATSDPVAHREGLLALGRCMTEAYGAADEVFDWWADHLPRLR